MRLPILGVGLAVDELDIVGALPRLEPKNRSPKAKKGQKPTGPLNPSV